MAKEKEPRVSKERRVNKTRATEILREDHQRMQDLFDDFADPAEKERRTEIRDFAVMEIRTHRALVEEVLLPAIREASGDPGALEEVQIEMERWEALLTAAEQAELSAPAFAVAWQALVAEINRHIEQGDAGLLKVAEAVSLDYVAMGLRMLELRRQVLAERPGDTGGVSGA